MVEAEGQSYSKTDETQKATKFRSLYIIETER